MEEISEKLGLKEEKHPVFKGVLLVLTVILFTFVFSILILLGVYIIIRSNSKQETESLKTFENYKFREYDPITDDSRTGIMTLPQHIPTNEYLTYKDEEGMFTMISNFGDDEYQCTGSCYCEEKTEDSRRLASSLLQKGVLFFMTAVSTTIAYQLSQSHYQEECTSMFMGECSESKISSSVDSCEKVKKPKGKLRQYLCIGVCVPNRDIPEDELGVNTFDECEDFESRSHVMGYTEEEAAFKFATKDLDATCKRLTEFLPEGFQQTPKRDDSICVGGTPETNPSIGCVEDYCEAG